MDASDTGTKGFALAENPLIHDPDAGIERLLEIMGTQAVGWEGDAFNEREIGTTRQWLRSKANSIEGGTSEVQLNVIAKRVLGLPD